jgi:hypothetical protein
MRSSFDRTRFGDEPDVHGMRQTTVAAIVGVATLAGSVYAADKGSSAANKASDAQSAAADKGIAEQRYQFDAIQKLLAPYVSAGTGALGGQQDLLGLNGNDAQSRAIQALQSSPAFTSANKAGQDAILARASATGGLRGGNVEAALGQFSPALLTSMINDQYNKLGGLTSIGQNAAAGVGNAGLATGNQVTNLLQQQGAAQAGGDLAAGRAAIGYGNAFGSGLGAYYAAGGTLFGTPAGYYTTPTPQGYFRNPQSAGGGGLNTFDSGGAGGDFSDIRLKTEIAPIGISGNGLPLYSFRYRWGGPRRVGHMAHEVAERFPHAVARHASGFLTVGYARL